MMRQGSMNYSQRIEAILRGYEPTGFADGRPMGYDLAKDNRTEFGFYWEHDQMAEAAKEITELLEEAVRAAKVEELERLHPNSTHPDHIVWQEDIDARLAELKPQGEK